MIYMYLAIDLKFRRRLIHAYDAIRGGMYKCPMCKESVIFRSGEKKKSHFAHRSGSNCVLSLDNESSEHYMVKFLLKYMLERYIVTIKRECSKCKNLREIEKVDYRSERYKIEIEYRYDKNLLNRMDVAVLEDGKLIMCFEIMKTHSTMERPEPWFEIKTIDFEYSKGIRPLICSRPNYCGNCAPGKPLIVKPPSGRITKLNEFWLKYPEDKREEEYKRLYKQYQEYKIKGILIK